MEFTRPNITKGDWSINSRSKWTVQQHEQRSICSTATYTDNTTGSTADEENTANAKAISAVPKLLEATELAFTRCAYEHAAMVKVFGDDDFRTTGAKELMNYYKQALIAAGYTFTETKTE